MILLAALLAALAAGLQSPRAASEGPRELLLEVGDGTLALVDVDAMEVRLRLGRPGERPLSFARSPDGTRVARLFRDGRVALHAGPDEQPSHGLSTAPPREGRALRTRAVRFAAGGDVVLVALGNRPAELWSWATRERVAELTLDAEVNATSLAISNDGERVALGDAQGRVAVWSARGGELLHGPFEREGTIRALEFDPAATTLAVSPADCKAWLWSLDGSGRARSLSHCDQDVFGGLRVGCLRFSPDGKTIVSTTYSFWEARGWDVTSGELLWGYDHGGGNPGALVATFSPDGERLVLSVGGVVLDARSGKELHSLIPGRRSGATLGSDGEVGWTVRDDVLRVFELVGGEASVRELTLASESDD